MVAAGAAVIAAADVDLILRQLVGPTRLVKTMQRLRNGSGVALWNAE